MRNFNALPEHRVLSNFILSPAHSSLSVDSIVSAGPEHAGSGSPVFLLCPNLTSSLSSQKCVCCLFLCNSRWFLDFSPSCVLSPEYGLHLIGQSFPWPPFLISHLSWNLAICIGSKRMKLSHLPSLSILNSPLENCPTAHTCSSLIYKKLLFIDLFVDYMYLVSDFFSVFS